MTLVKHSTRTVRRPCRSCGRKDLYWAHDTDRPDSRCDKCHVNGKFVMIETDGSLHTCRAPKPAEYPTATEDDTVTETGTTEDATDAVVSPEADADVSLLPPGTATRNGTDDAYSAFQALMKSFAPKVDREEVAAMIKTEVDSIVMPTRTVVERQSGERVEIDGAHHKLADVTTDILAGEHVMMVGPAGTGKSTIAEQAAESLGVAYYSVSLSPMTPASQILGYMQATGDYVSTLYRQAYEHGGVFHFDEIDNAHPSVLAVINAGLANGSMAFPDAMVKRHPDFRCVASANTYGRGPDRSYAGRQQIDAATLDRFAVETIDVDEALETQLCKSTGADLDTVHDVLAFVRKLRGNAETQRMPVVFSPRASVGMCRLIAAGKSWGDAVEARVRRGMSDADWSKVNR